MRGFCSFCQETIICIDSPLCTICGTPFSDRGADRLCRKCQLSPPPFNRARAATEYGGAIASAIQRFKYSKILDISPHFTGYLSTVYGQINPVDLIVPIPLHPRRLRARGFNQSALLAGSLARGARIHWDPTLMLRIRDTPTQTGLSRNQRRDNIKGAFSVRRPKKVAGKSILIVDDVITTGATVQEAALTLRRAGARRVEIIALARSVDSHY